MAVVLEGGCRVSEMREGASVVEGTLRIWNRIGRATGALAISLRVMEFAPGLSPGIQNDECDEILYVLGHSDPGGVGYSGQGQAHSARPLDQRRLDQLHPEGVRRTFQSKQIFIDGHSYDIDGDTGIYLRPRETLAIKNSGPDPIVLVSSQCP